MSQAENSKPSPSSNSIGWFITHKAVLLIIIIASLLYFSPLSDGLILTCVAIGILSIATATVMAGGVIDLGIPITAIISFTVAKLIYAQISGDTPGTFILELSLISGVVISGIIGFITGKIITRKYIPPYFGSFAVPCIILYLVYLIFNNTNQSLTEFLSMNNMHSITNTVQYIFAGVIGLIALLFSISKFGINLKATGSSIQAAIDAGIDTDCSIIEAYTISNLLAGVAGIILVNLPQSNIMIFSFPVLSWLPIVILGAVIGGNKFSGGRYDVLGAFMGGVIAVLTSSILANFTQSPTQATAIILLATMIIVMATDIKARRG